MQNLLSKLIKRYIFYFWNRFGKSHIAEDGRNLRKCETPTENNYNYLSKELQHKLRKRTYVFEKSEKVVNFFIQRNKATQNIADKSTCDVTNDEPSCDLTIDEPTTDVTNDEPTCDVTNGLSNRLGPVEDSDMIKLKQSEKPIVSYIFIRSRKSSAYF